MGRNASERRRAVAAAGVGGSAVTTAEVSTVDPAAILAADDPIARLPDPMIAGDDPRDVSGAGGRDATPAPARIRRDDE